MAVETGDGLVGANGGGWRREEATEIYSSNKQIKVGWGIYKEPSSLKLYRTVGA
jgi:hypothetical protein